MRVALVFPPQWSPAHPYHAMAVLAGELRRAGHDVAIVDLNLACFEHLLRPTTLAHALDLAELARELALTEAGLRQAVGDPSPAGAIAAAKAKLLERFTGSARPELEHVIDRAGGAVALLRDRRRFYDPASLTAAMRDLDHALMIASAAYAPAEIAWNAFVHPDVPLALAPATAFCDDRLINPFFDFLAAEVDALLADPPDLVAVSVAAYSQVLPALTLARLLKRRRPDGATPRLVLGGNFFSRLEANLREQPEFFDAFTDFVVLGEGEVPLVALARALGATPTPLATVPSLLYPDASGTVRLTPRAPSRPMAETAYVDLTGFPLARYLAPEPVISVRSSKGCYWGKCSFCDSHWGVAPDEVTPARFVDELRSLHDRFGVRHFELIDECLPPERLAAIAREILASGLDIRWFCNARTEPGFTPELLQLMRRAGATMVMWGVESGSSRLLARMHKGVDTTARRRLFAAAEAAGLWSFAYVFFGFPGETVADADETIALLADPTGGIHSYGRSLFSLGRHSPMAARPQEFGVRAVREVRTGLDVNLSFELAEGMSVEELAAMTARCTERVRAAHGDPLWMALRSRETLHLYLAHHGRDTVRDHRLPLTAREPAIDRFVF